MGSVRYTINNPDFTDLEIEDQVDFYVYMIPYDVMKNREYAGKLNDLANLKNNASFEMIKDQPLLIRMLTFISFGMIVIVFILWLICAAAGLKSDKWKVKRTLFFDLFLTLVLIYCVVFVITHLQEKAQTKLEDINDNI